MTSTKEQNRLLLKRIVANAELTESEKKDIANINRRVAYNYSDYPETTLKKLRESARELGVHNFKSLITGRDLEI